MKRNLITGCILARNEQSNIEKCVDSIRLLTDDILVLDNGSTDLTAQIAEGKGCFVIKKDNGNEAQLRNELIEKASGTWIIMIDADERLTRNLCSEIINSISNSESQIGGYRLNVNNYFGKGRWSSQIVCRIIRNDKNFKYKGNGVHPTIGNSIIQGGYNIGYLNSSIHHLDALINKRNIQKREKYLNILQDTVSKDNSANKYRLINYLGVEYTAMGEYKKAESLYSYVIQNSLENAPLAMIYLSENYIKQKKLGKAKSILQKILKIEIDDYIKRLNIKKNLLYDANIIAKDIKQRAYTKLSEIAYLQGDYEEALCVLNEALNKYPYHAHIYLNIAVILNLLNDKNYIYFLKMACKLNDFLKEDIIYLDGSKGNQYCQQSAVFCDILNYKNLIKEF